MTLFVRCSLLAITLLTVLSVEASAGRRRRCCPPVTTCATPATPSAQPDNKPSPDYPQRKLPPIEGRGPLADPAKYRPAS